MIPSRRKRPKKVEEDEEKTRLIEKLQNKMRAGRINDDFENDIDSSSSMASAASTSTSESESNNSSEEDNSAEDTIYEDKSEPKFDLIKSMLRDNYNEKSKKMGKEGKNKEVVEMEVVTNEENELNLMNERPKTGGNGLSFVNNKSNDIRDNNSNGPLFKDWGEGGMSEVLEELENEVIVPIYHPHVPQSLRVEPMLGILLHGPPGCGKTNLAPVRPVLPFIRYVLLNWCLEFQLAEILYLLNVSSTSEENIRDLFTKAHRTAPSIVFIDEIDAIATKREILNRVMEQLIVIQLMSCIDESSRIVKPISRSRTAESSDCRLRYVFVIGATNRPDAIDPALRRPGRFDREIYIGVPDKSAKVDILSVLARNLKVEGAFDLLKIAKSTLGFVGDDLVALTKKAGNLAMNRIIGQRKAEVCTKHVKGSLLKDGGNNLGHQKK
ncbi:unnamed protein product [Fraxinus pennsylvanica]|uniref:AAA+ ATPase domain-containing protein n=1 Tax=Fraxinus pennsylvanica TaxID=56036 RepID=A0AAD2AA26_9LAMI|nr:unnamed protein product [Fraxinus pennsylvanica]